MKIFHMSDTHISNKFNEQSFNYAMNDFKSNNYDLFVHSGDITQSGKNSEFLKAVELFKTIDKDKVFIPGNHDKRSGGQALYQKYFGKPNGVKLYENAVIIYVDSGVADNNDGRVGMIKYNMIKKNLNKYQQKDLKILVLHHHILPIPFAGRERNVLMNAGDLLNLILRFDVDLVLLGHKHYPNVYKIENTVFVNAGTASDVKTRYGDVNSFNGIEIDAQNIQIKIKRTDNTEIKRDFSRKQTYLFKDFGKRVKRLVHISNSFVSNSDKFKKTHFNNAVKEINKLEPDYIIHCGGIVEEGIAKNYNLTIEYFKKFKAKILYTPAGRDINYQGYFLFNQYFGKMDQLHNDEEIIFLGVLSSQYDSRIGIIGDTERKTIFKIFKKYEDEFKCLFLHHNVVPIPYSREKGLLEDSGDLLREIIDNRIDLVLTGTSSHPFAVKIGDSIIVNANSLSSVYHRNVFGNSYNLIDIYEKTIVVYEVNSLWGTRRIIGMWNKKFSKNK